MYNILITGNMGYIGPVLIKYLRKKYNDISITGYDNGYFGHCLTIPNYLPEYRVHVQYIGDLRRFSDVILKEVDVVVHLAAISNDPMGNKFEKVTTAINAHSSLEIAHMAKKAGVRRFVFASSCSTYGAATGAPKKEHDALNPLTAYAKSKVFMEEKLAGLSDAQFSATCLRFSTACGMSERLRLDLVLNDFVASAVATGEIHVLSDGTPWRPLIHVFDMSRAIDWAMHRNAEGSEPFMVVNIGSDRWTYQIGELASKVAEIIPGTRVTINKDAEPDKRSYRVDFSRFQKLAPEHQPIMTLEDAIAELVEGLKTIQFHDVNFRNSSFIRLKVIERHIENGRLNDELFWIH